jgi:hydroxymethylglutaryl-CoA synthase
MVAEAIVLRPISKPAIGICLKAGTEAMWLASVWWGQHWQIRLSHCYDTAQGKPGDALEYTASSGGAAYIIGPAEEALATIEATYSYVTIPQIFGGGSMPFTPSTASALRVSRLISSMSLRPRAR